MDYGPPRPSVHGILRARILEWAVISFSRGSSWPRDRTCIYYTNRQILYCWATREAYAHTHKYIYLMSGQMAMVRSCLHCHLTKTLERYNKITQQNKTITSTLIKELLGTASLLRHSPSLSFNGIYQQELPSPKEWVERGEKEGWGQEGEEQGDGEGEKGIPSFQSFLNIPTSEKTETQGVT